MRTLDGKLALTAPAPSQSKFVRAGASEPPAQIPLRSGRYSEQDERKWWTTARREPLVHFFAVGFALFALAQYHKEESDLHRIAVTPQRVAEIAERYRAEFGGAPTPSVLAELINRDIDDEVLYREGQERNLDRNDEIIRRRVVQKMQFVLQDAAVPAEPSNQELQAYYQAHQAQYATPATVSFSHIYFSDGSQGADAARRRALAVLADLSEDTIRAPEKGDPFPDLYDYVGFGPDQARRLFGDSEFSHQLFLARAGRWTGPLRSAYGWHLVRVQSTDPGKIPPFDAAKDRVRDDLIAARQAVANKQAFEALKSRFQVVREDEAAP